MKNKPPKDIYEFAWHYWNENRGKDPNQVYQEWLKWKHLSNFSFSESELNRYQLIFENNKQFIKGKKIFDIGCHMGLQSYFALDLGASFVSGVDRATEAVNFATVLLNFAEYTNHNFISADISDTKFLSAVGENSDTALLISMFNCITNHFQVLEALNETKIETIIIYDNHKDIPNDSPAIYYSLEDMTPHPDRDEYGYGLDFTQPVHPTLMQGRPNMMWYDSVLVTHFEWTVHSYNETINIDSYGEQRLHWCKVWTRNQ